MINAQPSAEMMRSLARAVSCGRPVSAWARNADISPEVARGWSELPEFKPVIEQCRVRHAERLVGRIGTRAERAIDRLAELSEHRDLTNVSLAATRSVLDQWVKLTEQFVQARQFQELTEQCEEIKANQAAQKKRGVGWAFKPKAD
jgi:hypothetical protein